MKLGILFFAFVFSFSVEAGMHQMEHDLKKLVELKQEQMGRSPEASGLTRGFSGVTLLTPIWGYGCWCYFQEDIGKGMGEPVNAVDGYRSF